MSNYYKLFHEQACEEWRQAIEEVYERQEKNMEEHLSSIEKAVKKDCVKIYPPEGKIFRAFNLTPYKKVKVVILGQDPYPTAGQADGLAFSSGNGANATSLRNIFQCLHKLGLINSEVSGKHSLEDWAEQGVLLLNTILTVEEGNAAVHKNSGWIKFTDNVIRAIAGKEDRVYFLLWGSNAQDKIKIILEAGCNKHCILLASHPAAHADSEYHFSTCEHFKMVNEDLKKNGRAPINWEIPSSKKNTTTAE